MKYYLAPMEGLTTFVFRNAYHHYFHPMDKYFTPFIVPHILKDFDARERKELDPEHNSGKCVVPQILTNNSEDFIRTAKALQQMGYEEVNLNLGCPSKTVVSKRRGAGFLQEPKVLNQFLEEVFEGLDIKISVKTRLGMEFPVEFEELLEIYNRYPLEELIVHPRVQKDYYKNTPNMEMFALAVQKSKNSLCYNGDLFTREDISRFSDAFPQVGCVMLGRGILANPALVDEVEEERLPSKEVLCKFHREIYEGYQEICSGDRNTLFKMKEFWSYFIHMLPEDNQKKALKKIKKSEKLVVYDRVINEIFSML